MSGMIPGNPDQRSDEWLTSTLREDSVLHRAVWCAFTLTWS
jgi:hypothetical protein